MFPTKKSEKRFKRWLKKTAGTLTAMYLAAAVGRFPPAVLGAKIQRGFAALQIHAIHMPIDDDRFNFLVLAPVADAMSTSAFATFFSPVIGPPVTGADIHSNLSALHYLDVSANWPPTDFDG